MASTVIVYKNWLKEKQAKQKNKYMKKFDNFWSQFIALKRLPHSDAYSLVARNEKTVRTNVSDL